MFATELMFLLMENAHLIVLLQLFSFMVPALTACMDALNVLDAMLVKPIYWISILWTAREELSIWSHAITIKGSQNIIACVASCLFALF